MYTNFATSQALQASSHDKRFFFRLLRVGSRAQIHTAAEGNHSSQCPILALKLSMPAALHFMGIACNRRSQALEDRAIPSLQQCSSQKRCHGRSGWRSLTVFVQWATPTAAAGRLCQLQSLDIGTIAQRQLWAGNS